VVGESSREIIEEDLFDELESDPDLESSLLKIRFNPWGEALALRSVGRISSEDFVKSSCRGKDFFPDPLLSSDDVMYFEGLEDELFLPILFSGFVISGSFVCGCNTLSLV